MDSKVILSTLLSWTFLNQLAFAARFPEASNPKLGSQIMSDIRGKLPSDHAKIDAGKFLTTDNRKDYCRADEALFSQIQSQLLVPFMERLNALDEKGIEKFFAQGTKLDTLFPSVKSSKVDDGIAVIRFERKELNNSDHPSKSISALKDFLMTFKSIEAGDVEVFDYFIDHTWRSKNQKYDRLNADLTLSLRGVNHKGQRISTKLYLIADIQEGKDGWTISQLRLKHGEGLLSLRNPAFTESTEASGLSDIPVVLRREAMRRGGYSASVTDLNNDGVQDLFFGAGGDSFVRLGMKTKTGVQFQKPQSTNVPSGTYVKSSVFADFDNDGDQDAVLVRFVVDNQKDDELLFFRNNGKGEFFHEPLLRKAVMEKNYAMPAAVADFNKDGFLDLYVGYPGKKDFTSFIAAKDDPTVGTTPQGLFYNEKGRSFGNVTAAKLPETKGFLFPHSALAFDYDHNRTTDLIVIDDRDNISPLYKNNGQSFEQVAQKIGVTNSGHGMSVATGDYNNDGLIDIAVTNAITLAESRYRASCERNWDVSFNEPAQGLRLFKNEGAGKFSEVTAKANFGWPGAATGGIIFTDYNNDGLEDLYVANGLWSGNKKGNELDSLWAISNIQNNVLPVGLKYESHETQSTVMNLLMNYEGDAAFGGKEKKGLHPSLGGFQNNRLYKNNGDGTFTDVAFHEGIDSLHDGYGVVSLDLNGDGRQELLLRNADPGVEANKFPPVQLFQNSKINTNNSVTLSFKGTESSKDAIGTEVVAAFNGKKIVKQLIANNGPQQSERKLHFGLGKASTVNLTIHWPNGVSEVRTGVKPGFHEFIEPAPKRNVSSIK